MIAGAAQPVQLAFDVWPDRLLPPAARQHRERTRRREMARDERERRALWRAGHYSEVTPPLCWLCPWIHAPSSAGTHSELCPLWSPDESHVYSAPTHCSVTEHIYWNGIDTCPWCGGPAYVSRGLSGEWVANSGGIHTLPACFGPRRYVCLHCWRESPALDYVRQYAHVLCPLCPVFDDCALALK
jgi:hypothetical protein